MKNPKIGGFKVKQKFKMIGKDETVIQVEVSITASKYNLTRYEQRSLKEDLKNKVHNLLRSQGYDVSQIKMRP